MRTTSDGLPLASKVPKRDRTWASPTSAWAAEFLRRSPSADQGFGNLILRPEQRVAFVQELPEVFVPIKGGWGRMGMTHIRLAAAKEEVLAGALRTAWKLRLEKNMRSGLKNRAPAEQIRVANNRRKKRCHNSGSEDERATCRGGKTGGRKRRFRI